MPTVLNVRPMFAFEIICREGKNEGDKRRDLSIETGDKHERHDNLERAEGGDMARMFPEAERLKERSVLCSSFAERVPAKVQENNSKRDAQQKRREEAKGKEVGERVKHVFMIP